MLASRSAAAGAPHHRGGLQTMLLVAALGAIAGETWRRCRATHERRLAERPARKPAPLQTWEGEGGQVTPPAQE